MPKCASCGVGFGVKTTVIRDYKADGLGAPFAVVLHDAVKQEVCEKCGKVLGTYVPDLEGLLHAVAFSRALEPRKLTGAEIKFMRKAMAWKAKDLAKTLSISPAHLSRCENGEVGKMLAPATEKLFRLCVLLRTPDRAARDELDLDALFDLIEIKATWDHAIPLTFDFVRCAQPAEEPSESDGKWRKEPLKAA